MQSVSDIWSMILTRLRQDLSETTIKTWFDETEVIALEGDTLILHCGNDFKRSNIQDRFVTNMEESLRDIFSSDIAVKLLDDAGLQRYRTNKVDKPVSLMESGEFTFQNFVVGPSNRFACSAAQAVSAAPGEVYNPLFIYGDSGLGKTHLLYATAHVIRKNNPNAKIMYIKGDEFINDFVESVRSGRASDFRTKYREADLLLVDDIQFVAGKVETQNEFFHTFNSIFEAGNQIVITSDRPPLEMSTLDDRLRTRFEWGLMADIQPPDLETRMAITRNKAGQLGLILSDDAVEYIASHITANIRQLEGVIKRLTAYKEILDDVIDIDSVKRAIKDVIRIGIAIPTPEAIIKESARYYGLNEDDLRGQSRAKNTAMARQVSMYLMRTLTNISLQEIGAEYENRNHSTVLSSIRKVEDLLRSDPKMAATVRDITSNINSN